MKSKIKRIDSELAEEIQRIAKQNKLKLVEASREIARVLKTHRNKRFRREEIEF